MKRCLISTLACFLLFALPAWSQLSPFIHVDQFGYTTQGIKVAILSDPQVGFNSALNYTPGSLLEVRRTTDDQVIFSGSADQWMEGATHEQSGDRGWWFDFSALQVPGSYTIYDPTTGERSPAFTIDNNPYLGVLEAAGRMFFYNRCGPEKIWPYADSNWVDGPSFLQDTLTRSLLDPDNTALWKDLSGGWFDAGDYNKYVTFARGPLHDLLWAWQENPKAFGDNWGIPESGNGIPDLLDEILFELDWLWKMTNPDGAVHIKMGSIDWGFNYASPPSANTDPRHYGPVCSAASIATAGVLAHAALVFKEIPGYETQSDLWLERAEACFALAAPRIVSGFADTECDDGTIKAGDADWDQETQEDAVVTAALHLYKATGDPVYHTYFKTHYRDTEPLVTGFWSPYKMQLNDALLAYTFLADADSLVRDSVRISIGEAAYYNWNLFYGYTEEDLYRAFMPEWSYHWGSNMPKANYANLNLMLDRYLINPFDSLAFRFKAQEQLHYFHGRNPLGLVYLSNMYDHGASRCVNEIYHSWFHDGTDWDNAVTSLYGPPPGYLVGGPNHQFSVEALSPPYGQPEQKSYLDYNTNWPDNSWEISEPAIYYQAAYLRLLANYVTADQNTATDSPPSRALASVVVMPNPVGRSAILSLEKPLSDPGTILDARGMQVGVWPANSPHAEVGQLPAGHYIIVWKNHLARFVKI
jgi:hypothetical protein